MISPVWNVRRVASRRNESGYALLTVLVATMVFGLMVMSLLTLVGTDARVQPTYLLSDEMKRSVDGALQASVAQLKAVPSTELAVSSDPCIGFTDSDFDIEDRTVEIDCIPNSSADPLLVPTTGDGGEAMTILGRWPIGSELSEQLTRGGNVGGSDLPADWAKAILDFFWLTDNNGPSVIGVGPTPLTVLGDVRLTDSFLGVVPKTVSGQGEALRVDGDYSQATERPRACYDSDQDGHEWVLPVFGFHLRLGQIGNIRATGTRRCDASAPARPADTRPATPATTVSLAANHCVNGQVVEMPIGRYGPTEVAVLNSWLVPGVCDQATLWFPPGVYRFDAAAGEQPGSLIFADPSISAVFGTWPSKGTWTPSASQKPQCDPAQLGASVVMGPGTLITHLAGHVSMCGDPVTDANARPVLSQVDPQAGTTSAGRLAWTAAPGTALRCVDVNGQTQCPTGTTVGSVVAATNIAKPSNAPVLGPWNGGEPAVWAQAADVVACSEEGCYNVWRITNWDGAALPGEAMPLSSALIKVRGNYYEVNIGDSLNATLAELTLADGRTCLAPRVSAVRIPTDTSNHAVLDLLQCQDAAGGFPIRTTTDLVGVTVDLKIRSVSNWRGWGWGHTVGVDYAWMELGTTVNRSHEVTMNRSNPAAYASFTAFGLTYLPSSNLRVIWADQAADLGAVRLPVTAGRLVANAVLSGTRPGATWGIGTLSSRGTMAAARTVTLRATIDGRLMATVDVASRDLSPASGGAVTKTPAIDFTTSNWAYCNKPLALDATCSN